MFTEEMYVVLESTVSDETFLTPMELQAKLVEYLTGTDVSLTPDLLALPDVESRAHHLMTTGCELQLPNGGYLQWYAVRLEK
ncbi:MULTISPECIES: chlororespiratory reduction protein 7 [unclassified Thermosynechococcus]|uniref:chlororespiratory reduction protein 7 n=1 Tax=unclassified Thermosynechococcus TaxID=2622553 RepID=UPI00197D14BF|nr:MULTISPECIES: chlororespiratory reduction protein 7 [unclassified Thermosynechococcus]MDR7921350.1 chlororespiratory reduction protein 7 [Thermosynechococcus sp. HY213]MDR7994231.1 chlororespiratory reduction protein 7 [Thermosynechococcus sp. TG252]QSF49936.1 chlororespiratory reduction protein 7 [Thermosynechococcus sp. TA-1]WNC23038.1 chlororespiratory reduction protein 7 [Thermosynechococcus sp. PP22]WNC30740.1 chlororespiratory reduction protein 7 [Thermosynechococcus sp. PKX82]